MQDTQPIPSFGAMLRLALGGAVVRDAGDDFLAMCAERIVFEFPCAPAGTVTKIEGRDALIRYLSKVSELLEFEAMSTPLVHPSIDGETYVLEFSCQGKGKQTGKRYDQNYISVVRLSDGLIVHYRDYWNPTVLLDAVGDAGPLKSTLAEFIHD